VPVDGARAKRHARASARRAKSAARMMMDTEVPRAEGDVLALQRELVDEHGQAEECRRLAARLSDSKKQKCEKVPANAQGIKLPRWGLLRSLEDLGSDRPAKAHLGAA
jgi:hypothetical protein